MNILVSNDLLLKNSIFSPIEFIDFKFQLRVAMEEIIQCMLFILCSAVLVEIFHHVYKYYLAQKAHSKQLFEESSLPLPGISEMTVLEPTTRQDKISPALQPFQNTQSNI